MASILSICMYPMAGDLSFAALKTQGNPQPQQAIFAAPMYVDTYLNLSLAVSKGVVRCSLLIARKGSERNFRRMGGCRTRN